jgi:hypothetical protein
LAVLAFARLTHYYVYIGVPNNANQGGNNIAYLPPAEAVQVQLAAMLDSHLDELSFTGAGLRPECDWEWT